MEAHGKEAWLLYRPSDEQWVVFAKPQIVDPHTTIEKWWWGESAHRPVSTRMEKVNARVHWKELVDAGYAVGGVTAAAEATP